MPIEFKILIILDFFKSTPISFDFLILLRNNNKE